MKVGVVKMTNLWQDLPAGPDPPHEIYAIIEVPKGSTNKYKFDCQSGFFKLDRVLYSSLYYLGDYGIIARTWALDEDALDILVLTTNPTFTGCVITARPIGVLTTVDEKGEDDKILGVPVGDPRFEEVKDLGDIAKHLKAEITDFFVNYKRLEPKKWVKPKEWRDAKAAEEIIVSAMELYQARARFEK
jgi:inorganic pyrophosphatase